MQATQNPSVKRNVPDETLWYISDERITSGASAKTAAQTAKWILTRRGLDGEPDEQDLFAALHTCAFQACHKPTRKQASAEPRELWVARWQAIREHIVEKNLGLAHLCIRRFRFQSMDEDDVLSEAMCALGRAIDRFNPWRGFKFSTYACNVITRALMRRGKSESRYRHLFPVQHDDTYEKASELPDVHRELCLDRLRVALQQNAGNLTDLEATVLSHRFCDEKQAELTYQEIGKLVGLSKERIRQIQNTALGKLRAALQEDAALK